MKLRNIAAFLTAAAVAITACFSTVWADSLTISAESITIAKDTSTFDVNINLTNNPGLASIGFDVSYDQSAMKLESVSAGAICADMMMGDVTKNPYSVSTGNGYSNFTDDGCIAIMHFSLVDGCAEGTYNIDVISAGVTGGAFDADFNDYAMTFQSGTVTVGGSTPTTESTTESTTETTTESTTVTESTTESTTVTESTTESTTVTETTTENTTEPTTVTTTESTTEPTTVTASESTTELTSESTTENTSESTTESIGNMKGDVNGDGKITSYDATQVLLCASNLKELTDEQKKAADINGDGKITSYDATRILLMASGLVEIN